MIKRDRALRRNDNGLFIYYRSLVANEIRKAKLTFYDNIRFVRYANLVQKLGGSKLTKLLEKLPTILNPVTHCQMEDKWTANHINEFFASLTKEYPKVAGIAMPRKSTIS